MKKLALVLGLVGLSMLPIQAQLTLYPNGQSVFGKRMTQGSTSTLVPVDTMASAVFLGRNVNNRGGYIAFGGGKKIWIGEQSTSTCRMQLGFQDGIQGISDNSTVFSYNRLSTVSTFPFIFYTDIRANSFIVTSDSRLKSDVKSLSNSADMLSSLSPVSYSLVAQSVASDAPASKISSAESVSLDESCAPTPPDPRTRYGFLAQEVKELFPELVVEDENGTMGIDYIGFIPILVDAVRDLRGRLEEQEKAVARMGGGEIMRKSATADRDRLLAEGCVLEQNRPNPFSSTSEIVCNIPVSVSEASIYVYDLQGQQILHLPVAKREYTSVSIEASSLNQGMYIYSLIADGVEIDSKRMIVTD